MDNIPVNNRRNNAHRAEVHPRVIRSKAERMRLEILIWTPTLICLLTSIICEFPVLYSPSTESFTGLRLTTTGIHPEVVFQSALDRSNFIDSIGYFGLDRGDTELPEAYELNEHGHRVAFATGQEMVSPMSNGSFGYDSLYKDFPRTLLYGGSPTLLRGRVPLQSPDDVNIYISNIESKINEFFEKALILRSEWRVRNLTFAVFMTVLDLVLLVISLIWGGYGIVCVNFPLWIIKCVLRADKPSDHLGKEEIFQLFRNGYEKWGLVLSPIALPVPRFGGNSNNCAIFFGMLFTGLAYFEYQMNMESQIAPDEKTVKDKEVVPEEDVIELDNIV